MYQITQEDIHLLQQREKTIYVSIEVKNKDLKTLDEVSGVCTDFSYEISSESGIRRSATLSVIISDKKFNVSETALFWIDKIIYIKVGYKNNRTQEMSYYPVAHFLLTENSISYDAVTKELSMSLVDLMSMFTGERGGFLVGYETKVRRYGLIPDNEITEDSIPVRIRDAIVDTVVQLGEWNKYRIDDVGYEVPYDIEFGMGVTVFEIIDELVNLYPAWEFFFDYDGTFICQEIPTCANDACIVDDSILRDLIIQEPYSNSFSEIFNLTEVFGKCWETDYFVDNTMSDGSAYSSTLNLTDFVYQNNKYYGFTVPNNNGENPTLKINELEVCPIVNSSEEPISPNTMISGQSYVVKFYNNKFFLQGQYQIHAIATLWCQEPTEEVKQEFKTKYNCNNMSFIVNPDNPFGIDKIGVKVRESIDDEAIWLDKDCLERAEYENWMTTVLSNQVSMELIAIPWLDVNQKISHHLALQDFPAEYIIKGISNNVLSGIMTLDMINFYPLYPYITTEQALKNYEASKEGENI